MLCFSSVQLVRLGILLPPAPMLCLKSSAHAVWLLSVFEARKAPDSVAIVMKRGVGSAQGCITAMESCSALAATFAACGDDLDRVPAAFTRARAPDAHAVQDLELLQVPTVPDTISALQL